MVLLLALSACNGAGSIALSDDTVPPAEHVPEDTDVSWVACEDAPPVVLNEVLASNAQGVADEDGDQGDWLEIALTGDAAVDVAGWALSKDATADWTLPALTLAPGDVRMIHASGKDRADAAAPLHASFTLDTLGETLFLHMPDGCVADHVETGRLYADESLGRASDDGAWEYFLEPTPGAANTTESRPGFAALPTLSPGGGFYDHDVVVEVIAPEGADLVRYTLDGAAPDEESPRVEGSLDVDAADQPVALRVRAFQDGLWPSRVVTATYSEDAAIVEAGIRVVSLVVDPVDLWDDDRGIYAYGDEYEAWYPYFGANFWERWERDLHVEVWGADGTLQVSQDAGIQIAGGYSRAFDQRNFELLARSGYDADTFGAPLFDQEEMTGYHRLYLRNGGDWCSTQIVDASVQGLLRDASGRRYAAVDAQAYEPALVYLNGEFWGLYELKERLDEWYVADHHGEDPDALDRVKLGWTHDANWELEQGDWDAFEALETLVAARDLSEDDAWADFAARVDLENLASAVVAQGWIGNTDWWGNNLRLWRPHTGDGRWRWMVYDFGHGWPSATTNHLGTSVATSARGLPIADALENEAFRQLLVNVHADYLNTTMAGDAAAATVQALADEIEPVIGMQRERWCGGPDMAAWQSAVAYAVDFAARRAGVMDEHVVRYLAPEGHATLSLAADPADGGTFALTVVEVGSPFRGTYYRGVPVTVTAVPAEGRVFAAWSDETLGEEPTVVLPMEGDTTLRASFMQAR